MEHTYLNDGNPLPANHKHAGQIGILLTFEDGTTQNVYAPSEREMSVKLLGMYGNTRARVAELKTEKVTPATPPAPPVKLTVEQRMATVADLADPAKAGQALIQLVKDETGRDLQAEKAADDAKRAEEARVERLRAITQEFISNNPDFVPSKRNAQLLRDRVASVYGIDHATATNWAEAFAQLRELGVLESAPATQETPSATRTAEPSAPAPARPSGTGTPPSRLNGGGSRPATGQRETYEDFASLDPSDYERRLRNEPGFADRVQRAFEQRGA